MSSKFNNLLKLPNLSTSSLAQRGAMYYDTDENVVKVYQDGEWVNLQAEDERFINTALVNASAGTTVATLDTTNETAVIINYYIKRYYTGPEVELVENGDFMAHYNPITDSWSIGNGDYIGQDTGVEFSINLDSGTVFNLDYTSPNISGTPVEDVIDIRITRI